MIPPEKLTPKEPPPPRPPVYPTSLIEAACHALEAIAALSHIGSEATVAVWPVLATAGEEAAMIIRDGLRSHRREVEEGRSRG